jgi:hypothetical protein
MGRVTARLPVIIVVKHAACQTAPMLPESLRNFTVADPAPGGKPARNPPYRCPQLRTIRSSFAGKLRDFPQEV